MSRPLPPRQIASRVRAVVKAFRAAGVDCEAILDARTGDVTVRERSAGAIEASAGRDLQAAADKAFGR